MTLNSFFPEQIDELKTFIFSHDGVVRCLRLDGEMESTFNKVLLSFDEDPEFPHALIECDCDFVTTISFFDSLLDTLHQEYEQNSIELKKEGVTFNPSQILRSIKKSPDKFIEYATTFADSLPDSLGSLVFFIDPVNIYDTHNYKNSIEFLATEIKTPWVKFIVRDQRVSPQLEGLEREKRISLQIFHLSPEEIKKRTKEDLKTPGLLSSSEARKYISILAGFSFADKKYDKTIQLQQKWVNAAKEDGSDCNELANALYNLGNTYMANEQFSEATDSYCEACQICSDNKLDSLAPFIYTNFGLNLHRQDDFKQAFACLKIARDMFKAQNQIPGEAHVVDCLAQIYALDEQNEKAEKTWKYALKLYQGITNEHLQDVREGGEKDISLKLENFYKNTDQESKVKELKEGEGQLNGS